MNTPERNTIYAGLLLFCSTFLPSSHADVILDGSLGPAVTLTGDALILPAEFGLRQGNNLFHSLQHLQLDETQQLTFTGPDAIRNLITRITGPAPAVLNGSLTSTMPLANVFLLSPHGLIIGPNAHLNLPADVHLSTAEYIDFSDGHRWSTDVNHISTLSSAAPAHFGFLNAPPATIQLQQTTLNLANQAEFSLLGGAIHLDRSQINAPAGTLNLIAIAETGHIALNNMDTAAEALGPVSILDSSLNSSGIKGGRIWLRAGNTVISASRLSTRAEGALHTASTEHERPAGIHLRTHTVELKHGSLLDSSTLNANPGGQVTLQAQTSIHLQQHSRIASTVGDGVQSASGDGGNILLETPYLTLTEGSVIQTGAGAFLQPNSGNAGSIFMQVGAMFLKDRSSFITSTLSDGQGGDILLTADRVVLDNAAITASSLGQGDAGQVNLNAHALAMHNISVISTRALEAGGGDITLNLQQQLLLLNSAMSAIALGTRSKDNGGNITVQTPTFIVLDQSEIFASALAGNGGNIRLTADYLLTHLSPIDASSALGIDGEIRIDSPVIELDRRLLVLPTHYADASQWINQPCVERLADNLSSLIWLEHQVLPILPYGLRSNDPLMNTAIGLNQEQWNCRQ